MLWRGLQELELVRVGEPGLGLLYGRKWVKSLEVAGALVHGGLEGARGPIHGRRLWRGPASWVSEGWSRVLRRRGLAGRWGRVLRWRGQAEGEEDRVGEHHLGRVEVGGRLQGEAALPRGGRTAGPARWRASVGWRGREVLQQGERLVALWSLGC